MSRPLKPPKHPVFGESSASGTLGSKRTVPHWLAHLQTAVILFDERLQPQYLNPAAEDMLGISGARATEGRVLDQPLRASRLAGLIGRAARDQRSIVVQDVSWRLGDETVWVDAQAVPLPDGWILLELHDAALRRRILDEHDRSTRKALSRHMVRQLAHEIRNPLAGLRGAAQLLGRGEIEESQRELTEIICREADRLHRLLDDLLTPARTPRLSAINVHEPVERLCSLLRAEAPERVAVIRDYDPSLPTVDLDHDQILQALLNLGRNALQAGATEIRLRTRSASHITWAGRLHRLAVVVEIIDNGPGVPDELTDSLFFPLVTSREEGTGLGLSISQEIADRHGGHIAFESRPGWTVFRILLPVPDSH
ncbi:MAG: PAS domain-containing protein [Xanthomonadaceae bacterium]|nr:PAS domain-containing protein [Xanthomonadaceae bacterium]